MAEDMRTFSRLHLCFGSEKDSQGGKAPEPLAASLPKLIASFHRSLLPSPRKLQIVAKVPGSQPLDVLWLAAGHTAGVAFWLREQRIDAISIVLSGLDRLEDAQAMAMAARAATTPFPPQAQVAINKTKPPLLATLYCKPKGLRDPAIATASLALAEAFFGMLGVGSELQSDLPV